MYLKEIVRIISALQAFATSKQIVDKATNVFLKLASFDVKIKKTVRKTRIALRTIVPFHQVFIFVIFFSIWHNLVLYKPLKNQYASNSGGSCKKGLDCGIGGECINGKCPDICESDKDCSKNKLCLNLKCGKPSTLLDMCILYVRPSINPF